MAPPKPKSKSTRSTDMAKRLLQKLKNPGFGLPFTLVDYALYIVGASTQTMEDKIRSFLETRPHIQNRLDLVLQDLRLGQASLQNAKAQSKAATRTVEAPRLWSPPSSFEPTYLAALSGQGEDMIDTVEIRQESPARSLQVTVCAGRSNDPKRPPVLITCFFNSRLKAAEKKNVERFHLCRGGIKLPLNSKMTFCTQDELETARKAKSWKPCLL